MNPGIQMLLHNWKIMNQLKEAYMVPACCMGKSSALAWNHNLWDLMLGASCILDILELVLPESRNPEETDAGLLSSSPKNAARSGVFTDSVKDCNQSLQLLGPKRSKPHTLVQAGSGLVLIPSHETDKCVRTKDIICISLKRHLGLKLLLLWNSDKANKISHSVHCNQLWWQNNIMLTWCC